LKTAYPEHDWADWKFKRVRPNYWDSKENQRKFFDWVLSHKKFKTIDAWWLKINKNDVIKAGGM
jgi:hypothetical protein